METEINPTLVGIIANHLNVKPEQVIRSARLYEDLAADSLDHVELLMDVEEKLLKGHTIPESVAEELRTVGQIEDYVTNVLRQGTRAS